MRSCCKNYFVVASVADVGVCVAVIVVDTVALIVVVCRRCCLL